MTTNAGDSRMATKTVKLPKQPKKMTAAQRNKLATQGIATILDVTDVKAAVTAALETVYERFTWDSDLRERVREKYLEIAALSPITPPKLDLGPVPFPIRSVGLDNYTPYGKFDPYQLEWTYGVDQLRAVLARGTQNDLREAIDIVQARNPGTKSASRSRKDVM